MQKVAITLVMLSLLIVPGLVLAESDNIFLQHNKMQYVYLGAGAIIFLSLAAVAFYHLTGENAKKVLFLLISTVIVVVTAYLLISIVYSNWVSPFHGPVHWHAEVEFDICGQNYLIASRNIAVDQPLHTHADSWVHVETTPITLEEVELHHFFEYIGGSFTEVSLAFPTDVPNTEPGTQIQTISVQNGDNCGGVPGTLKMLVNGAPEPKMGHYVISPLEAGDIDKIKIIFNGD